MEKLTTSGHKIRTCGAHTGHIVQDIAFCHSEAWAEIIANAVNTQEELVGALEEVCIYFAETGHPIDAFMLDRWNKVLAKAKGEA